MEKTSQNSIDQTVNLMSSGKNSTESLVEQLDQKLDQEQPPLDLNLTLSLPNYNNRVSDREIVPSTQHINTENNSELIRNLNSFLINFDEEITDKVPLEANIIHGGTNVIPTSEWMAQANAQRAAAAGNTMPYQFGPPQHPVAVLPAQAVAPAGDSSASSCVKRCSNSYCNTTETPLWRRGPLGPKTLCNACGIKYRKEVEKKKVRDAERILELHRRNNQQGSSSGGQASQRSG